MKAAGREIHPDDLPPILGWEYPVWELFALVRTQWRTGFNGRTGLDYNPVIKLVKECGGKLSEVLPLLQEIESVILDEDAKARKKAS